MTPTDNSTPATRREAYDPHAIERRRQAAWSERNAFATPAVDDDGARHVYVKPSAPFTSGNIHIGHVRSYSIGDAYARFLRARGDAVLFAFGYDAFGLPAELGAIAQGISPSEWVAGCAEHMTGQLQRLGFSFDWARAFLSSDPVMYRWSQWLFLELLDAGLIYRAGGSVDWCDHCSTTLASIQVEHGTCWRCHGPVRLIQLPQWYLRISTYLEENDRRAAELEHWDDTALASQSYILGRVDGVEAELAGPDGRRLAVFTPHREHLRDARFVLISPRHPEIERWAGDPKVQDRLEEVRSGGWERSAREADTVPIVDTGHTLAHPLGAAPLPVLISPVVDSRFGVTAVLGIPAADRTDEVIARRLGLARDRAPDDGDSRHRTPGGGDPREGAAGEGDPFRPAVRYRAYDFSISRQRSWGTPIPIVHCERCGAVPVPRERLPVVLPTDLRPTGVGNPLAERADFYETDCPRCGGPARRETDTLDCHFDALWLWVPACVPPEARELAMEEIFAREELRAWLPAERLVAGSDSGNFMFDQRITTKALRDIGPLEFMRRGEPFAGALMHEMVIRDGRKMSKHLGNVVDPDELVARFGADAVRLAVLYAARPQRSLNWTDSALQHCHRFLSQLWSYSQERFQAALGEGELEPAVDGSGRDATEHLRRRLEKWCAVALERLTTDMEQLEMHSAVRNVMRLFDRVRDYESRVRARRGELAREDLDALVDALVLVARVLFPFAPHTSEELWLASGRGHAGGEPTWPELIDVAPGPGGSPR